MRITRLDRRPLLQLQLEALRRAGVSAVQVVSGCAPRELRSAASGVTFVRNECHDRTDSLQSFHLSSFARRSEDLVLVNGDAEFSDELLDRLLRIGGSSIAVDAASGEEEAQTKVHLRGGRLIRMGRELPTSVSDGESVGLLHLTAAAAEAAFAAAAQLVASGRRADQVGAAVNAITRQHPIVAVDTAALPWHSVGHPASYAVTSATA